MKPSEFVYETTQDGSPTVRIRSGLAGAPENGASAAETLEDGAGEAMHSLKGAFSETLYIYGRAIATCLENRFEPRVLSVGLGLGYNEIMAAAAFAQAGVLESAGGASFESVPELRDWFLAWLANPAGNGGGGLCPPEFVAIYDEILRRTSAHFGVGESVVQGGLAAMIASGRWRVHGALTPRSEFDGAFGCICFDAFSSKTSPDLWSEEFLKIFLQRAAARNCVLSTYACTGALKRALKERGFEVQIREGFASKRDSTFAVRMADGGIFE